MAAHQYIYILYIYKAYEYRYMISSHAGDGDEREHPARPVQPAYAAHLSLGLPKQSKTYCKAIGYP